MRTVLCTWRRHRLGDIAPASSRSINFGDLLPGRYMLAISLAPGMFPKRTSGGARGPLVAAAVGTDWDVTVVREDTNAVVRQVRGFLGAAKSVLVTHPEEDVLSCASFDVEPGVSHRIDIACVGAHRCDPGVDVALLVIPEESAGAPSQLMFAVLKWDQRRRAAMLAVDKGRPVSEPRRPDRT